MTFACVRVFGYVVASHLAHWSELRLLAPDKDVLICSWASLRHLYRGRKDSRWRVRPLPVRHSYSDDPTISSALSAATLARFVFKDVGKRGHPTNEPTRGGNCAHDAVSVNRGLNFSRLYYSLVRVWRCASQLMLSVLSVESS